MYVVIVETEIDAEARSGQPALLARLGFDHEGKLERELGLEVVNHENRRALAMVAMPGEIFMARRWWRMDDADTGGDVWFTVSELGDVCPTSEKEAMARLQPNRATPLALEGGLDTPVNIFCRPASLSGKPILRGNR